jgi:phage FluMu protein Com
MNGHTIQCDDCGKFTSVAKGSGASYARIYDFVAMGLDRERIRCPKCTEHLGPVQSNARPHNCDMSSYQTVL